MTFGRRLALKDIIIQKKGGAHSPVPSDNADEPTGIPICFFFFLPPSPENPSSDPA